MLISQEIFSLEDYQYPATMDLVTKYREGAKTHPCILCGEYHKLRINTYSDRLVRSNIVANGSDSYGNVKILVFSIYCPVAEKRGEQYTKRVLPPFVVPGSNICLYHILYYLSNYPDTTQIDYDAAGQILGTRNEKTIRKHIRRCAEIINKANVQIAEILGLMSNFCNLPDLPLNTSPWDILKYLVDEAAEGQTRMHGGITRPHARSTIVHLVYIFNNHQKCNRQQLNRTLHSFLFHDTS